MVYVARFQFFSPDRQTDRRRTDKTDCLTPLRACARAVITPAWIEGISVHYLRVLVCLSHKGSMLRGISEGFVFTGLIVGSKLGQF